MNFIKKLVIGTLLAGVLAGVSGTALVSAAKSERIYCPDGTTAATFQDCGFQSTSADGTGKQEATQHWDLSSVVVTGINVIIGVIGLVAVVVVVIGGLSYTTSYGDASKVNKAKDTILYGVIGVIIATLAWAIVNYFVSAVFK